MAVQKSEPLPQDAFDRIFDAVRLPLLRSTEADKWIVSLDPEKTKDITNLNPVVRE
jgi:hypothetical protein